MACSLVPLTTTTTPGRASPVEESTTVPPAVIVCASALKEFARMASAERIISEKPLQNLCDISLCFFSGLHKFNTRGLLPRSKIVQKNSTDYLSESRKAFGVTPYFFLKQDEKYFGSLKPTEKATSEILRSGLFSDRAL